MRIIAVAATLLVAGIAFADVDDSAQMEVFVEVSANMSVQPGAPFIDLGSIQMGEIYGYIPFIVDANTQTVKFYGAVSQLFKGYDPTNPEVLPIDILVDAGVDFSAPNANPTGGFDNHVEYIGDTTINGFPGKFTEWIEFESSQNNRFSQTVSMDMTWIQDDPEKPMGEYGGYVEFFAMIVL